MKLYRLSLLLLLSGCTYLPWKTPPPADNFDSLRTEHRYVSALAVLDTREVNAPDYTARRNALLDEAKEYQTQVLHDVGELAKQKRFAQGQTLLDEATPELPPSDELRTFTDQFQANRDRYVQRILDELYQLRSPQLTREQPLYDALQAAASDPELRQLAERHQQDADFFSRQLAAAGAQALAQKEYTKAAQYLGAANQLAPSSEVAQQLSRAEQALNRNRQKYQAARSAEREQRYRELSTSIEQALQERDYAAAQQLLEQARGLAVHSEELDAYQRQLDTEVATFVKQQTEEGNRRYANGHIEEALQIWRQADLLAPSQELKERIEKAQRFMERYQQLQKNAVEGQKVVP
jgi:uncharacterized protein YeaO (DUF488 family)